MRNFSHSDSGPPCGPERAFWNVTIELLGFGGTPVVVTFGGADLSLTSSFCSKKCGVYFGTGFYAVICEDLGVVRDSTSCFEFLARNCGQEFSLGNSRTNISCRNQKGRKQVIQKTAKATELNVRRRGESPHSYSSPPFPFCLCFHRALDRSLGRGSRRRQLVLWTS